MAITLAAAWPAMISRAMFGPVRAATGWPGSSSAMTSVIRSSDPCSRPLARLTIGIHGWIHSLAVAIVERIAVVGTPTIEQLGVAHRLLQVVGGHQLLGSVKPGRYASLVWSPSISAAVSGLRAHSSVGCRGAITAATVVPHDPPPAPSPASATA